LHNKTQADRGLKPNICAVAKALKGPGSKMFSCGSIGLVALVAGPKPFKQAEQKEWPGWLCLVFVSLCFDLCNYSIPYHTILF
jgi:hypothetical protein